MAKKIFISQPMRGRSNDEILIERTRVIEELREMHPDCEILDTFFKDFNGNAVQFLGKSIQKLGEADVAVFLQGWEETRGCFLEHMVAEKYEIPRAYMK